MSVYVLDTDILSLYQTGHFKVIQNVVGHLGDTVGISVISIEEQLSGWQSALNQAKDNAKKESIYRRLAQSVEKLAEWLVFPVSFDCFASI